MGYFIFTGYLDAPPFSDFKTLPYKPPSSAPTKKSRSKNVQIGKSSIFRTSQASEAAFPNLCEDTCAAVPNASLKFRRGKIELCLVPPAYIQFTKKPKCTEAVEKSKPSGMERNLAVVIVWEESDIQTRGGHAARRRFYKCKCQVDIGTRILC